MDFLRIRRSYGSLYLLVFLCIYGASGYQILPVREVMNKAMFINNDGTSPILSAIDQIGPTEQLLFPFMNFTCDGSLTRLMFVASRQRELNKNVIISWPMFFLWHSDEDNSNFQLISIGPSARNQITSLQPPSISSINGNEVEVVMVNFASPIRFVAGDILGLRQHNRPQTQYLSNTSSTQNTTLEPLVSDSSIRVLRQSGGYGLALICDEWYQSHGCPISVRRVQEMPYIAIETTPASQQCAMGFLNKQSLRMIVETTGDVYCDIMSFSFPGIPDSAMSMSFTQSGPLRKIVIAARFNIHVPDGWPELQIIRTANGGTPNVAFTTNIIMEPKPTGYLNLYEYDLTAINFTTEVRDTLNISWHGNNIQQPRFSLAYYNNGSSPAIPMVSIVVGNCDSETDLWTLNTLYMYCEDVNVELPSSDITATQSGTEYNSTALLVSTTKYQPKSKLLTTVISIVTSIVVLCSLLSIVVVILVIFVRQKKHKMNRSRSSMQESDSRSEFKPTSAEVIEMDMNEAYIAKFNTIHTESNVAYSSCTPVVLDSTMPHDYDIVIV